MVYRWLIHDKICDTYSIVNNRTTFEHHENPVFSWKLVRFFGSPPFSETKNCNSIKNVVSKWKSKLSAFQNIKKLWNRLIILEDRSNYVSESRFNICSCIYLPCIMYHYHVSCNRCVSWSMIVKTEISPRRDGWGYDISYIWKRFSSF